MTYEEAYKFIEYSNTLGSVWGLETVKELLLRLDNPQDKLKVIHIAGTNGKGSIGAFLEYGLRGAKLSVGRYISPTIFTYLERFQINGEYISKEDFAEYIDRIKTICADMLSDGFRHPTSFEIETTLAFLYFLEKKVDVVLLECGMGGRDDATNVLKTPLATVFASISYDHTAILGSTIEAISKNKAGIMRKGCPVIISHQDTIDGTCAKDYLIKCAKEINAPYYISDDCSDISAVKTPLKGTFQKYNLSAALKTISVVFPDLDKAAIYEGISHTYWPGRYEIINEHPVIIRDGGHNIAGISCLKESLLADYPDRHIHLIMGIFKDKDYLDMLSIIMPIAYSFTAITPPNAARALHANELASAASGIRKDLTCKTADNAAAAFRGLDNLSKDDVVVICGSLSIMYQTIELCQK